MLPPTPQPTHDTTRIDDTRIEAVRPLITPALLMEKWPGSEATLALVERSREAIARILRGHDDRLLVVVGPCSIHDHDQALEYAARLKAAAEPLADALLVVMRTYFEKPRTTVGWKGFINDPYMDDSFRIEEGLRLARRLLIDLARIGVPAGASIPIGAWQVTCQVPSGSALDSMTGALRLTFRLGRSWKSAFV